MAVARESQIDGGYEKGAVALTDWPTKPLAAARCTKTNTQNATLNPNYYFWDKEDPVANKQMQISCPRPRAPDTLKPYVPKETPPKSH